jgi:hypothetical protein
MPSTWATSEDSAWPLHADRHATDVELLAPATGMPVVAGRIVVCPTRENASDQDHHYEWTGRTTMRTTMSCSLVTRSRYICAGHERLRSRSERLCCARSAVAAPIISPVDRWISRAAAATVVDLAGAINN